MLSRAPLRSTTRLSNKSSSPVILKQFSRASALAPSSRPVLSFNTTPAVISSLCRPVNGLRFSSTTSSNPLGLHDASLWKPNQRFVKNEWYPVDAGSDSFDVINPATEEILGSCPDQGVEATRDAIKAAAEAFPSWSTTTAKERHDLLLSLFAHLADPIISSDIAKIITAENGKTLAEAAGEVVYANSYFQWFGEEALRAYGSVIPPYMNGLRNVVWKEAVGPVGIITPWNFPIAMLGRKLAPALAAGCTVVIKVPSETPFTALALIEVCRRVGFPAGVINVVTTHESTKDIGKALCEAPEIKKISFTGSTGVGKILTAQSASTLKKLSMELGGNAPAIIFDDADLDKAVAGVIASKFRQSGQTCVCINRIYVQESVLDQFTQKLLDKVKGFKVGRGDAKETTHGPLIHAAAVKKVAAHVDDALSKGAKLVTGGKKVDGPGYFFEPTILTGVTPDALANVEETFGPLAAIQPFKTEEEVIQKANDTSVGLAGYFFSESNSRVWRVAEKLQVGMVGANTGLISSALIPFGGIKESGSGKEGSSYGLADYQNIKYVAFSA